MGANASAVVHQGDESAVKHQVRLAVTPIGPTMAGAYHSSVSVGNTEFSFSRRGVSTHPLWTSHWCLPDGPAMVFDLGFTAIPGYVMQRALQPFFLEGTYDLLKKNCNSFSDCALFFLLGQRLDQKYCKVEQLGQAADKLALVRILSFGHYEPNPKAIDFTVGQVLSGIRKLAKTRRGRGLHVESRHAKLEQRPNMLHPSAKVGK